MPRPKIGPKLGVHVEKELASAMQREATKRGMKVAELHREILHAGWKASTGESIDQTAGAR